MDWSAVVSAVAVVLVAIIEAVAQKERKKVKTDNEAREQREREQIEIANRRAEQRRKESHLQMQMIYATLQLSIVTANALTNGHNNGNVERAREAAKKAEEDYNHFLQTVALENMAS